MMTRHVFVVDDDGSDRHSLIHLLSGLPDTAVHSFASSDCFLAAAEKLQPGCVLLDLRTPEKSGIAVLEKLGTLGTRFCTIMLSGDGNIDTAVQALKLNAFDFLEKPCDNTRLLDSVEQALSQQASSCVAATRRLQAMAKIRSLSLRERDVLLGLMDGQANKVIAYNLGISPRTVEIYRAKLMEKLDARNLPEALGIAFAAGLYPAD